MQANAPAGKPRDGPLTLPQPRPGGTFTPSMKLTGGSFFGLLSVGLGAGLIFEIAQSRDQAARIDDLRHGLAVQRSAAHELANELEGMRQQKDALSALALRAEKALADANAGKTGVTPPLPRASSSPQAAATAGSGGLAGLLGQMLKDPAMLHVLRAQQATALRMMYGDLVKQWALSPADADTFYNLLLDKQMAMMTSGQDYLNGKSSAANMGASLKDFDSRLRSALGDNLFNQYQDYEKTIGDRVVLNQFQQQLAATTSADPLTTDQTNFLLRAMTEERQAQAANATTTPASLTDQSAIDTLTREQSDINQRVDQRASGMLTAAQFAAFKSFQGQMLEMQKAGMQMGVSMAGGAPTGP